MIRPTRRKNLTRPELLEGRALLSVAGTPDSSFGGGTGYALAPSPYVANTPGIFGPGSTLYSFLGQSSALLPDGDVTVGGVLDKFIDPASPTGSLLIAEFKPDGTLDPAFGVGGRAEVPVPGASTVTRISLVGQSDNKLILALDGVDGGGNETYVAARFNVDGSLDATFGGGVVSYPASTATAPADRLAKVNAAVLQPDGKIVLAGTTNPSGSTISFAAVRLDTDGSLDTTFGQGGTSVVPVTLGLPSFDSLSGAVAQPDGKIVLAGEAEPASTLIGGIQAVSSDLVALRLTADGTLDTTFGTSGSGSILIPPVPIKPSVYSLNVASSLALQPDGKVLISGTEGDAVLNTSALTISDTLHRLDTDGTLDAAFGTDGRVLPIVSGRVGVQSDGKIVVAGGESLAGAGTLVARLQADGSPDPTFGNSQAPGLSSTRSPYVEAITDLLIQPDGSILATGNGLNPSLAGLRYTLTAVRITASASTGPLATPLPEAPADTLGQAKTSKLVYDPTSASFLYPSGSVTPSTVQFGVAGTGQTIPAVADYDGNGQAELAAYLAGSGTYAIPATPTSKAVFLQFGTPGVGQTIPVPADYEGTGKADIAVYLAASGSFAILPSDGSPGRIIQFGTPGPGGAIPAPADYFGLGHADLGVYLPAAGGFAVADPAGQHQAVFVPFGAPNSGAIPVPGDYDGSGHVELAIYLPSLGEFIYRPAGGGPDVTVHFGTPNVGELPVPGDYDGSGRTEFAVYDPRNGFIAYRPAGGGGDITTFVGNPNTGEIPVVGPAGALPVFTNSGSSGKGNALLPPGTGSTNAVVLTKSQGVPSGPMTARVAALTSIRSARTPVNQAASDPSKLLG